MSKKLIYFFSFILVLRLAGSVSAEVVAHWRLDEGSGDTVIDISGSGNDGTIEGGPQWVVGKMGGALKFDGDDDQITLKSQLTIGSSSNTVAAWVKIPLAGTEGLGSDERVGIILGNYSDSPNSNWELHALGQIRLWWNGGEIDHRGTTDLRDDSWHHLTWVRDKATNANYMYIDGQLETMIENLGTDITFNTTHTLGGDNRGNPPNFHGIIDDVRIYNHAMIENEILAVMEGSEGYPYALGPNPSEGTLHMDTWASISWRAGDYAVSHDVYFGDNFDNVNNGTEGTFLGNQTDTIFVIGFPGFAYPDGLVPGTTYYWRIDEVNDTEPNSPWKGDIWNFSIPPKTAYFPDPADSTESVSVDVTLGWTAGWGAKLHTVYFGETFDDVSNAAGGLPHGSATYTPGTLKMAKTYYWRVDEFDIVETHKGDVWSFTTEGGVTALDPANGAVDVSQTPTLTWAPGLGASHEVYFGADPTSLELKASGNLGAESFEPGQLEWNTTYYWRVDEANNANPDSPWTGPLWSFTTADFLIIDDMESYNDLDESAPESNRIYLAWIDGFDNPAVNGSVVGNLNPPFAEQTIVHSGLQSMPMAYDNAVGKSEATLTLTSNNDWTVNGVTTLTIWYQGASGNAADPLYVVLNGGTPVTNDDPDAATRTSWTEWNIDLQTFGVDLANVTSITLGLGNRANPVAGGAGMLYFDDIRLYAPAAP
ncbi:MAG: LamG domain-containing protein [Planctomycetes bacterium]|nr:LamG domain-containing protein [Planctomycetota bacterium]